jgi:predicted dehydrogenase
MSNRRDFLRHSALVGAGLFASGYGFAAAGKSANEKINFACIGAGGKGEGEVDDCARSGNLVAMCDVDDQKAAKSFKKFPDVKRFKDFREMLDKMGKEIDAVTISTPDHIHAPAAVMAMELGKHVYCQKPMTKAVWEARLMAAIAKKNKVATQMGNQGTAAGGLRRGVELIQSGLFGPVKRLHAWTNRPIWPQGVDRPEKEEPVPETLNWPLWLGPTAMRPYNSVYLPFNWRGWYDWGTGAFGDMACHTLNLPFWGLKMGYPTSVQGKVSKLMKESYPSGSVVDFQFPAREGMPELHMTWSDGDMTPKQPEDIELKLPAGAKWSRSGIYLVGSKGGLYSGDDYGGNWNLVGVSDEDAKKVPESIERSPGHFEEWVAAIKGGKPAKSNFPDYSSLLTEVVLLGTVAQRLPGKRLEWDAKAMKMTNAPEADKIIKPDYPKGWILDQVKL